MSDVLEIKAVKQHFPIRSGLLLRQTGTVYAVDGIDLTVRAGETLGLVGESGCGKSTLGRTAIRIYSPTEGVVRYNGQDIENFKGADLKDFRRNVQMVFQDPYSSLNPRQTISSILKAPLKVHDIGQPSERDDIVIDVLEKVGLGSWARNRYPHEFSGGQRQRIAIARAVILKPQVIIADEPVSALDVSVQSQILNLMKDLQDEMKMAYLFIAHDLAVVKHMSDRLAVMYLGRVVEYSQDPKDLYRTPRHPYTQALLAANPVAGQGRRKHKTRLKGDVPSPVKPPSGCRFHPRCPYAQDVCKKEVPQLRNIGTDTSPYQVACHFVKSLNEYPTPQSLS